jgi:hypothetical protein
VADRNVALTTVKGGINRQRTKGGALEDSLYDLVNGYVSKSKTIVVRPGTDRVYVLPTNTAGEGTTKGLMAFEGALHVFSDELVDVPAGIVLHILTHPDATPETPIAISAINFAAPFMGFPYVSATFENGDTYHFWLQSGDAWEAETAYKLGDIVIPTTGSFGLAFQAQRLTDPNTAWAANVLRALGDVIEPTEYNDFYYTVVDTQGDNPRSGTTEPVWPTEDGAQVFEDSDGSPDTPPSFTEMPDVNAVPAPTIAGRYSNGIRR